ncbi:MAG: hypothetical protein OXH72_12655 [Caldilineaceae bacterium]|nr:hypothetical protein [Caldilineaceae bacterium]
MESLPLDYFSSPAVAEQERTAEAVTAMQLFPGEVLSPVVLVHIENAWHRNGPPEVHLQAIHVIQKISSDWRTLLPDEHKDGPVTSQPPTRNEPCPSLGPA